MSTDRPSLLSRDAELSVAVSALSCEAGGAVVVVGEAGIGKSTFLDAAAAVASRDGILVRRAQGAPAEVDLPFVGLHDLLSDDLDAHGDAMTPAMHTALAAALLRSAGAPAGTDAVALNLGVLELLELLSPDGRLLLVLDDVQWIDQPTLALLRFALRRLPRSRVSVLAAARPGSADLGDLVPDHHVRLVLGGMDVSGLRAVVEHRSGARLSPTVAVELHELAGGNPMLALEIVRSSDLSGVALRRLTIPERHRAVLGQRIAALSTAARESLLAAALLSRPTVAELTRLAALPGLLQAESRGLVEIDGNRIRFSHPLFASTCRDLASAAARRGMHRRLASVAVDETERARHLGRSAVGPDEETAAFIAKVASGAADRAAVATAADLAVLAAELTPPDDTDGRLSRTCTAAALLNARGDHGVAVELLRTRLAELEPGPARARCLLAMATFATVVDLDESLAWLREARGQPGLDGSAALEIEVHLLLNDFIRASFAAMLEPGAALEAAAEAAGRADLAMMSRVAVGMAELMVGVHDTSSARWSRLAADAAHAPLTYRHPDLLLGSEALLRDDHEGAARLFGGLARRARDAGDIGLHADLLVHLGHVDLRRGRLAAARAALEENLRVRADGRTDESALALLAHVTAWEGDAGRARALAQEAMTRAQQGSDRIWEIESLFVLALVDVAEGRHEPAVDHLLRVDALMQQAPCGHPNIVPWFPEAVEALLALDRVDAATEVTDRAEAAAARADIPTADAMARRCRGLVLAHRGDLTGAGAALLAALTVYDDFGVRLEAARTLLALGVVRRRRRQKARAREDLGRARDIFRECGAVAWEVRAARELERAAATVGGAALTSGERAVAELAAAGVPNREIAGRLYLSEKTVEAVLTRVYRKLSVRSRTELARCADLEPPPPGSATRR